jgi:hypothetical protein
MAVELDIKTYCFVINCAVLRIVSTMHVPQLLDDAQSPSIPHEL